MGFLSIFGRGKKEEEEEQEKEEKDLPPSLSFENIAGKKPYKTWAERWEQYQQEEVERPDYTKFPGVAEEAQRTWYYPDESLPPEERARVQKVREELPKAEVFQLIYKAYLRNVKANETAIAANAHPYRREDTKLWQSLPHVPHPMSGRPMPRMAIKTHDQAQTTFWDFFKQFQFGLWGYRQRPYPEEKPFDIQQMLGYKWLEKRYADFTMRSGGWYYKDRMGRTRGPMELVNMKTAWAAGIIDRNTFVWGDDMSEWAPISMIYGLEKCVDGPDMALAAAGLDFIHRITRGLPIFGPKKGHERKSYKQLQSEAIEKKELEKAVMRLNGGIWPGERTPSHCLFMWAGGSQLTTILEEDIKVMPDKFVSYEMRKELAALIPGLRPWEVLEVEQIMEKVTYGQKWFREPLSSFTMRADYDEAWFSDYKDKWEGLYDDVQDAFAGVDKKEFIKKLKAAEKKDKATKLSER